MADYTVQNREPGATHVIPPRLFNAGLMRDGDNTRNPSPHRTGESMLETRQPARPVPTAELGWLAMALAAHALLLLLPINRGGDSAAPAARSLQVKLQTIRPLVPRIRHERPGPGDTAQSGGPAREKTLPLPQSETPFELHEPELETPVTVLSTARLLHSAREASLEQQRTQPLRQLGAPLHRRSDEAALPGSGSFLGRSLAGAFAPASTVVVDRWLASDRSHNVVMNLPNGETLCGRAEAWDAMRPLIESVMMFRRCGGGGARTFTMPADRHPSRLAPP